MNGFVDAVKDLRNFNQDVSHADFDIVCDLLQNRLPQLHAKSVVQLSNIESVFSLVEMGRLLGRLPGMPEDDVKRASIAIRRLLAEIVETNCKFSYTSDDQWQPSPVPSAPACQAMNKCRVAPLHHTEYGCDIRDLRHPDK